MNTDDRDQVIRTLLAVSDAFPELRIGQLIDNAMTEAEISADLFYVPDTELTQALLDYRRLYGRR